MLILVKDIYRKSIMARQLEYSYYNYTISIEIEAVEQAVPIVEIGNNVVTEINILKLLGEEAVMKIDLFMTTDTERINSFLHEVEVGKSLMKILNENFGKILNGKGETIKC